MVRLGRYRGDLPLLRRNSRNTVEADRSNARAIDRIDSPRATPAAIRSRSTIVRNRPDGSARGRGGMPPAFPNQGSADARDAPAAAAASTVDNPAAIPRQNSRFTARDVDRINTPHIRVLH